LSFGGRIYIDAKSCGAMASYLSESEQTGLLANFCEKAEQ